jgi:carbonic anhydrase/acetyltransferase-like protein (isoleucine patch superfamily)
VFHRTIIFQNLLKSNSPNNQKKTKMARITGMWGVNPQIGENCKLADDCQIIGDVQIGEGCEIGSKSVISGTNGKIIIGNRVRISDDTKITASLDYATIIEDNVYIAANVTIESSLIKKNSTVGTKCFLKFAIIHAASRVLESTQIIMATWGGNPAQFLTTGNPITTQEPGAFISEISRKSIDWQKKSQDDET